MLGSSYESSEENPGFANAGSKILVKLQHLADMINSRIAHGNEILNIVITDGSSGAPATERIVAGY